MLRRNERLGRRADERDRAAEVIGRRRHVVAGELEDLLRTLGRGHHQAAVDDRADLVEPVHERRDDPEVAAAAADAPEELRVLSTARRQPLAGSCHDLGRQEVVGREPALALEPAAAAPQREAGDPGRRETPTRDREAVLLGRRVELPPGQARFRARRARLGIDGDPLHRREVDHDAVVARPVTRGRVPAAAHRHLQAALTGEVDGSNDVVRRRAARDQRGMPVMDAVPDEARLVELVVAGLAGANRETRRPAPRQPGPKGSAPAWVLLLKVSGPSPWPTVLQLCRGVNPDGAQPLLKS